MSKKAHTPEERAALLAAVGAPAEAVEAQPEPDKPAPKAKTKKVVGTSLEQDQDAVVQDIVTRAGADREAALGFVDAHVEAVFDANKVSKLEAAARGLDSSAHNKALWASIQTLRSAIKTGVRKYYAGTIAAKVRATSTVAEGKRDAEFEAFVSSDAMMTAFEAWKESQKG